MVVNSMWELFALGGYGVYVWPAYGLSLVVMLIEGWLARRAERQALDLVAQEVAA
jgi:heme exporter protein CcmD